MTDHFDSIRHFNQQELPAAIQEIFSDKRVIRVLDQYGYGLSVEELKKQNFNTLYDFQKGALGQFLKNFSDRTTTEVHFSGLENIDPNRSYLYIANHRDIIMDSAYLQLYFFQNNVNSSKIAIGDNLVPEPLFLTIAKANKMFLVKRSASLREKLLNSKELSEYIHQGMTVEKESVWIAQRNGRTKNGIDLTQQGLLKMLTYWDENRDVLDILQEMNITPLTVSYEYEPCDQLKARELALSEKEKYVKKPGEDFNSICQGIFGFKGNVHLVIGQPINDEIAKIDRNLRKNDKLTAVAKLIDQQIYSNYHLYATNYIAYDALEQCQKFAEYYTEKQKEEFLQYIHKQSIIEDVNAEKMENYLLNIYANPVKTKIGGSIIPTEENDW
ncbi:MAG: 1-acyl-sn-glycerol-3-phosphate acyltransferase [Bacteroidales bacterium]|nr:1-acyl-sn-glycerol-3-phosphate acyltransferase [Bacteroidales bacterium]